MSQTKLILFPICVLSLVAVTVCDHLIEGEVSGKQMIFHSSEQFSKMLFAKRVKNVFYNDPNDKIISGVVVYDNSHSGATAMITAGGVGFTYVNIRMKSLRGKGLDYDIGIYSTDEKKPLT